MSRTVRWSLALMVLAVAVASALPSQAAVIFFNTVATGEPPGGSAPWAKLTIQNHATNQVKFTLDTYLLTNEFVGQLRLNLSPYQTVSLHATSVTGLSLQQSGDNGEQGFDILLDFPNQPSKRVKGTASVWWILSGSGLDETRFNALSVHPGVNGNRLAMLHIQNIGGDNNGDGRREGSGKIVPNLQPQGGVIPEPATLLLFGMGLAAPLAARWRKR
ncbi:MAG: PEP-CTERM sorting domain-containing protein [bacterium]|nr:PEP-CTERM sorting domain-containing protein [bacterium]